jgi:uncharacterized membrane protein
MRTQSKQSTAMGTGRIEAFSDGVFAVAITLLVLNLQVPDIASRLVSRELWPDLLSLWPKVLIYMLSFMIVGIYWVGHHNIFHCIEYSDRTLLWLNLLLLMCIVFLPFPTAIVGKYPLQQSSVVIYGCTVILTGLALEALWLYATIDFRLVDKDISPQLIRTATKKNMTGPIIYICSIGISFFSISVSLLLFLLVPIVYILYRSSLGTEEKQQK